jgi:hypothetical protein
MKLLTLKKSEIKSACNKAVNKLKDAPFVDYGDYVKLILDQDGDLEVLVMSGNSWVLNTETLGRISFVHPDYDSEQYMEECGIEVTEESKREWNWTSFYESNDLSNMVEALEYEVLRFIEIEYPCEESPLFEIELV